MALLAALIAALDAEDAERRAYLDAAPEIRDAYLADLVTALDALLAPTRS